MTVIRSLILILYNLVITSFRNFDKTVIIQDRKII